MKTFTGIIDDFGVESFMELTEAKDRIFGLKIRARMNPHRNATFYGVSISKKVESEIREQIERKNWKKAGTVIKSQKTFKDLTN